MHYDKNDRHVYILDGTRCGSEVELFEEVSKAMKFPSYFGMNWDAMIDCLRDVMDAAEKDVIVIIQNSEQILINDYDIKLIFLECFEDAKRGQYKFIVVEV